MKSFLGKCVVITGAGSGIGRALAQQFAEEGARLALCDIDLNALRETASLIGDRATHLFERIDVSSMSEMQRFADLVQERMQGADVLINNAGVSFTQIIENTAKSDMEWVFGINYWGVVHGCTVFLPQLKTKADAYIVNISSLFGLIPMPTQAAYVASKFAVRGYTESLSLELANTHIGVSCVHPGGVKTNIARNGRHHRTKFNPSDPELTVKAFDQIALLSSEAAARGLVRGIKKRRSRIVLGIDAWLLDRVQRLSPSLLRFLIAGVSRRISRWHAHQDRKNSKNP